MAIEATEASTGPAVCDAVEAVLGCLLEVLGLRRIEPDLPGRVDVGGLEEPLLLVGLGLSVILSLGIPEDPRMARSGVGDGECVNFSSLEADSMLVWRSSKLTDGRKSYVVLVCPD